MNGSISMFKLRSFFLIFILFCCAGVSSFAAANCKDSLRGINLVPLPSAWFNGAPELKFPDATHISYYKNVGMKAIRLPVVWEVIQPQLYGELNSRYLAHILDFLKTAQKLEMKVLIDLHNYGRYKNKLIGSDDVPNTAFADIWTRLAQEFANIDAVHGYGLMNEPHDTNGLWHQAAQFGVDGIRVVDSKRYIYVAGDRWSNSQLWAHVNPEPFVVDPNDKIVYEAHIYFDDDFSGRYRTAIGKVDVKSMAKDRLQPFIDWLVKYNKKGAIGEVGVPMDDPRWLEALKIFLKMADDSCLDWFMWAGGGWRETYELSLEPIGGKDRPQIDLIRSHLSNKK